MRALCVILLRLRQKGAHLKNVRTIDNKHSMISHCSPFWRKNTGEYPPVSNHLNKCPFSAVDINYPFLANARDYFQKSSTSRQHDSMAILPFSHDMKRTDSLKSQSEYDKLSGRSASRLRKEILGTRDKEVPTAYTMLESLLEIIRDKCGASVTDRVEGMLARSGPVCLLVRDPVLFPFHPCPHREFSLDFLLLSL